MDKKNAGYQGADKRPEATDVNWHVVMRPGIRRTQKLNSRVRFKVEHPFWQIKCPFGCAKVRYRGLAKNTAQLITLFAVSNHWMAREAFMQRVVLA